MGPNEAPMRPHLGPNGTSLGPNEALMRPCWSPNEAYLGPNGAWLGQGASFRSHGGLIWAKGSSLGPRSQMGPH